MKELFFILTLLILTAFHYSGQAQDHHVPFEYSCEYSTLEIAVTCVSEADARQVSVVFLPLYNGYEWAVSGRYDDLKYEGFKQIKSRMEARGMKTNWYLNDPRPWGGDFAKSIKGLVTNNFGVGGHSLSHAVIPACNINRVFEEMAGVRALLESISDRPVNSYGFSYIRYNYTQANTQPARPEVDKEVKMSLERAGYHLVADDRLNEKVSSDFSIAARLPHDGRDIRSTADAFRTDANVKKNYPCLMYNMHANYSTNEEWENYEQTLDYLAGNPSYWYANMTEYAAYRYQYRFSKVENITFSGNTATVTIRRPRLRDANDDIPLTIEVRGVSGDRVREVTCATASCTPAGHSSSGNHRFHLGHNSSESMPERIGFIENTDNHPSIQSGDSDVDYADISGVLHFTGTKLTLQIRNSGERLDDMTIIFRCPLGFTEGITYKEAGILGTGSIYSGEVILTRSSDIYRFHSGSYYFIAQVDFKRNGRAGRIHLACNVDNPVVDPRYPQCNFKKMGPFDTLDISFIPAEIKNGRGSLNGRSWQGDNSIVNPPIGKYEARKYLDPEKLTTFHYGMSGFTERPAYFMLFYSTLISPADKEVSFMTNTMACPAIFVNGIKINGYSAKLKKGENDLLVVYNDPGPEKVRQADPVRLGLFFRIVKPGTQNHDTDIQYYSTATSVHESKLTDNNQESFSVSPNPAKDRITVTQNGRADITKVEVLNVSGQLIMETRFSGLQTELDLPAGEDLYFIRVTSERESKTLK